MNLENEKLQHDLEFQKEEFKRMINKQNEIMQETNNTEIEMVECSSERPKNEFDFQPQELKDSRVHNKEEKNSLMVGETVRFVMFHYTYQFKLYSGGDKSNNSFWFSVLTAENAKPGRFTN